MYLVINLGLKSIRGIIFNTVGKKIYSKSFEINTFINHGFVEQSPEEYVYYLNKIFKDIKNKRLSKKIKFISTTTSASCLLFLNKKKKYISNIYMVLDNRVKELSEKLNTKLRSNIFNIDDQILKVLWFLKNSKKNKSLAHVLNSGDYLNFLITGQIFTDKLNFKKLINKKYNLLSKLKKTDLIKKSIFPKCHEIGTSFNIDKKFIKKYNLDINAKFILTTYDAICATIGSSNSKKPFNNISEVSGTVTSVRLITDKLKKLKNKNLKVSSIPLLGIHIIGASNNLGGGLIGWLKDFLLNKINFKSIEKYFKKSNGNLFFLPLIFGDRYLEINSDNGGVVYGLKRNSNLFDFVKAGILSAGFMSRKYMDDIAAEGFKIKSVTLSGGLTRISFINKIKAEIFAKKTFLCNEYESTAFGCFLIMMAKVNKQKFTSICKFIKTKQVTINKKNYEFDYKNFLKLLENYKNSNYSIKNKKISSTYNTFL
jgi:sugar (pentulose or hexulose) kinase